MSVPHGFHPAHDVVRDLADQTTPSARVLCSFRHLGPTPAVVTKQRSGIPMSKDTPKSGIRLTPEVGRRVAEYYRREYPKNTVKHLAREYGCAPETAKKWLQGQCPSTEHLLAMWAHRGNTFFAFVFASVDPSLARMAGLAEETNEIQRRIRKLHEVLDNEG